MDTITTYTITIVIAAIFTFAPYTRKITEWFIVIIHELGHGLTALLFGGGISGIRLHKDGSGSATTTHYQTPLHKIGRTFTLFAGYSFPIYFGAALIITVILGQANIGTIILISLGVLTLFFLRNLFGIIIIATYLTFLIVFNYLIPNIDDNYTVTFMASLFIIRGTYDIIKIAPIVFDKNTAAVSDFHILSQESSFINSPRVWFICFIITQIVFIFLSYQLAKIMFPK